MNNLKSFLLTQFFFLIGMLTANAVGMVKFKISGLEGNDVATISINSNEYLATSMVSNGVGKFTDVPTGSHAVKIEAAGYNISQSKTVIVKDDGSVEPATTLEFTVTKMSSNENEWVHSWTSDGSVSGYTTTSYINTPPEVEFLGKKIVPSDVPAMSILLNDFNILLSDEDEDWTQEYAYRLLEMIKTIPCARDEGLSKFTLTSKALANDIKIIQLAGGKEVEISKDAFYYANPFLVNLDGVRGRFFSKRLHHAMVNFFTDYGNDKNRAASILRTRFGCEIENVDYESLTNENAAHFQEFNPTELVSIINMFEELPEGFHKIPHLNYLVRRKNGHIHPTHPSAVAVAWCSENGYMEFMESAFGETGEGFETLRVILHEKTHFLWAFSFSEEIKNEWIEIGGWYRDPNANEGWNTTKDTEFVTAYAHAKSPDEDMAESVAYYLKNPDLLRSRSLPKYEFIRDRIMHGIRYISKIPDHLTFEVLNLYPDYDYPGKIKRLDVKVEGAPTEDKKVTIEIELNHIEGFQDGATGAYTRIKSSKIKDRRETEDYQYIDVYLGRVDDDEHLLRGEFFLSKYSKSGYWFAGDIEIADNNQNQRFSGQNDYIWNMYINNPLEDLEAPEYECGSLDYKITEIEIDGHKAKKLQVLFKASDNIGVTQVTTRLTTNQSQYSFDDAYGVYNPETQMFVTEHIVTEFHPDADYYVSFITLNDKAENRKSIFFSESPEHEPIKKVYISTLNPDYDAPELDLNRLFLYAEPTNPEEPDGETLVTINFYARDNKSGLGRVQYSLRDPQGFSFYEWHYHRNFDNTYFVGDPTIWEHYIINCVLPRGSTPGIWGLSSMQLQDKAFNGKVYDFVETLIFEPDESTTDYVLFSELNNNLLTIGLTSEQLDGNEFFYRIIHEESGQEINGSVNASSYIKNLSSVSKMSATVDVSSLKDGRLIVIATIRDNQENIIAVRSTSLIKNSVTNINTLKFNTGIQIKASNGIMTINNPYTNGESIYVYTINGQLIKHIKAIERIITIPMQQGVYIVKVNGKSFKVML